MKNVTLEQFVIACLDDIPHLIKTLYQTKCYSTKCRGKTKTVFAENLFKSQSFAA